MRKLFFIFLLFISVQVNAQDTTFYDFAARLEAGETGSLFHDWGSEKVTYLGMMKWLSPTKKELEIKIVTSYQKITQANGFNDRSLIAILTNEHKLVKIYDMVKRQNLPLKIEENKLYYEPSSEKQLLSELPKRFGERFCVSGLTCFDEYTETIE